MQPAYSNTCISSSANFWYLRGMVYDFHVNGGPVVDIPISNRLVFPTFVEGLDTMLLSSFFSKFISLASCTMCVSCAIIDCLFDSWCSHWKLDSGGMVGSYVDLFLLFLLWFFLFWSMMYCWYQCFQFQLDAMYWNTVALGM